MIVDKMIVMTDGVMAEGEVRGWGQRCDKKGKIGVRDWSERIGHFNNFNFLSYHGSTVDQSLRGPE